MNIPGFDAEASLYKTSGHYQTVDMRFTPQMISPVYPAIRGTTVRAALMRQVGITCSNTCPAGQILCECENDCRCCLGGCRCNGGYVFCDRTPPARGGSLGDVLSTPGGLAAGGLRGDLLSTIAGPLGAFRG